MVSYGELCNLLILESINILSNKYIFVKELNIARFFQGKHFNDLGSHT